MTPDHGKKDKHNLQTQMAHLAETSITSEEARQMQQKNGDRKQQGALTGKYMDNK